MNIAIMFGRFGTVNPVEKVKKDGFNSEENMDKVK